MLSAIISHKRHLENHRCVVEKVALLCSVLPFDPTWSTIHCLLRSIAAIPGDFSLSYAVADLNHSKKITNVSCFWSQIVFIYEFVTARPMPGGEWHGPAGYHEHNHWSGSSELGWLHLCNSARPEISKSLGGRGWAVQPHSNPSTDPQSQQQQLLRFGLKLPTWSRDGFKHFGPG